MVSGSAYKWALQATYNSDNYCLNRVETAFNPKSGVLNSAGERGVRHNKSSAKKKVSSGILRLGSLAQVVA